MCVNHKVKARPKLLTPKLEKGEAGLPDGLFSNQKSKFGLILEGLVMEEVAMFYGHLVHFTVFCYILWTFGVVRGILVYFFPFWYFVPRKIWQP
jgi:hypothetical protein